VTQHCFQLPRAQLVATIKLQLCQSRVGVGSYASTLEQLGHSQDCRQLASHFRKERCCAAAALRTLMEPSLCVLTETRQHPPHPALSIPDFDFDFFLHRSPDSPSSPRVSRLLAKLACYQFSFTSSYEEMSEQEGIRARKPHVHPAGELSSPPNALSAAAATDSVAPPPTDATSVSKPPSVSPHAGQLIVRGGFLLCFYLIVPVSCVLVWLDIVFWDQHLRMTLPYLPEHMAIFGVLFRMPHVMASLVTYADKEYLSAYRSPLLKCLLAGCTLTVVLSFFEEGSTIMIVVLSIYNMYHAVVQQYGITLMLVQARPEWTFNLFKWVSIFLSCTGFLVIDFVPVNHQPVIIFYGTPFCFLLLLISTSCALHFFFTVVLRNPRVTRAAIAYFLSNVFVSVLGFVFFSWGYYFFATLMSTFVHDATAFAVYAVHDQNRNRETGEKGMTTPNFIYRTLKPLRVAPIVLCVPMGIASAYVLEQVDESMFVSVIYTLLHYYMEGHMWKRGSMHRQYVNFVP
jgi:hypothetical protein